MKYITKTIGLAACLITLSACEFGHAPDMTMLEQMNAAQSTDECDEVCQQFYVMIEKKYGANYESVCNDNCIATEWEAYLKGAETGPADTTTVTEGVTEENVKGQVTGPESSEDCDQACQSILTEYLNYIYGKGAWDAETKKAEFKEFFEWYASLGKTPAPAKEEKTQETYGEPQDSEENCNEECKQFYAMLEKKYGTNYESACDEKCMAAEWDAYIKSIGTASNPPPSSPAAPATPTVPSTPATPVVQTPTFQISPEEVNSYISKLGFVPDTVVILSPKYLLSSLDALKKIVVIPTEQQMLIDMLPCLMTNAKYLLLSYNKNTTNYYFIVISQDAIANRAIETTILKLYQATSPARGLLKIATNIGFARLTNAYIAGSPYAQIEAIFKGTQPLASLRGAPIVPCISALSGKTFDGFIAKTLPIGSLDKTPDPLLKYFDMSAEQMLPNNGTCWYKMK